MRFFEKSAFSGFSFLERIVETLETCENRIRSERLSRGMTLQEQIISQKSVEARRKDVLIFVLVFIVLVALLSLLVDLCNPNIGWVRA